MKRCPCSPYWRLVQHIQFDGGLCHKVRAWDEIGLSNTHQPCHVHPTGCVAYKIALHHVNSLVVVVDRPRHVPRHWGGGLNKASWPCFVIK